MSGCWLQLVMSGETAGIHGRQLVQSLAVLGDLFSQLVILGETAVILGKTVGILGRHLVRPRAVLGDLFSQHVILGETAGILGEIAVILGETVGILGRHLVKPQAVFGDLELSLQHHELSYPDLAVNELLEELVDQPQLLDTC